MILRAFDALGVGTDATIIPAMAYARTHGANIINASHASLPGDPPSQAEQDELSLCNTAGILFVAAAGNEISNNDSQRVCPASHNLPNIIAVAATDQSENLAWFSNYGQNSVHVAAPGTNIDSTKPGRQTVSRDNFDNGDIGNWTVDAPWGVSTNAYGGTGYALSDSPNGDYANNINLI
jgi:Subtilase family